MVKLSNMEKYSIQGMLHDGMEVKDIAKELGRHPKTINKYVDNELDHIHTTITNVQEAQMTEEEKDEIIADLRDQVYELERQTSPDGLGPGKLLNKTAGDNDGVAIMTQQASEISDIISNNSYDQEAGLPPEIADSVNKNRKQFKSSRTARGNLFNIKQGKVKE